MPLVVHYWADLQSVHGLRCYDNIAPNAKLYSRYAWFVESCQCFLSHVYLAPPLWVTLCEYYIVGVRNESPWAGLSCGVVCLMIFVIMNIVQSTHTWHRQTQLHIVYRDSIASRGKKNKLNYGIRLDTFMIIGLHMSHMQHTVTCRISWGTKP